jgi:hypothetical protein
MREYFYEIDGVEYGPIPYGELLQLRLPRDSKVWYQGLGSWIRADRLPALKEVPLGAPRNAVGLFTGQPSSISILDADFDVDGKPKNYRIFAIVALVVSLFTCGFFSIPISITTLVFSFLVDSKYNYGFFLAAEDFSRYTKIGLMVAAVLIVISLVTSALGFIF